ncbi:MAG: exodeoxyribonuclease VII small subunit [Oscillospiraceae bacterium]|nr:exodeoxyribonuclease VII small subunit [Oscillospiraceae bacterium]
MSYEESVNRIEGIIAKLSGNELPLDQAVELYKKGMDELTKCREKLEQAKITVYEYGDRENITSEANN